MTIEPSAAVRHALAQGRPVVALETTLICHGMPQPENLTLAVELERVVQEAGAVPATIGVLDGHVKAGLERTELERLTAADDVAKCSTRDLPFTAAGGGLGATTVAATVFVAHRLGIRAMATGGLGGVHLGGESSMDVSADLGELARSPIAVICSGVKAILDQRRTLERLESLGVPVVGYQCDELPGFYTVESGLPVPRISDLGELRLLVEKHLSLGLPSGIVVVQPPPRSDALGRAAVERLVEAARLAAEAAGISGPAETPFMLRHMAKASAGATVRVNYALALANARLGARLAVALSSHEGPETARAPKGP
jgi:pseudouridine-5'-phosphate glycosidase